LADDTITSAAGTVDKAISDAQPGRNGELLAKRVPVVEFVLNPSIHGESKLQCMWKNQEINEGWVPYPCRV
jgi:hypothetical protein